MIDPVGTITDTARKLPSHLSLRNRKHEKKNRGEKFGVMRQNLVDFGL